MCLCYSDSEEKGGKNHFGVQNITKQNNNKTKQRERWMFWRANELENVLTFLSSKNNQNLSFFFLSFLDDISGGEFPSNFDENCFCKKHFSAQTWKKCFILFHHEFQHWSFYVVKLSVRFLFGSLPVVRWSLKVYFVIE